MIGEPVGLEGLEAFAFGVDHPEGIAIGTDGAIYVGGEAGQIYRVDGDAPEQVADAGAWALGLALDGEGRLYVCSEEAANVQRIDLATGERTVWSTGTAERPMRVPNWGAFDAAGNYYVSDSGAWGERDGLLWVVRPGGRAEVWSEEPRGFPNGLAVAPDGSRVYLVESMPARLAEIPIRDDGSAGPLRTLCDLGWNVPDGVAVCDDGSVVIACYRPDAIYRWAEGDGLDVVAYDPQGQVLAAPTNVAFAGDDLGLLVVPNLAGWHVTRGRVGLRGTPLFRPSRDALGG